MIIQELTEPVVRGHACAVFRKSIAILSLVALPGVAASNQSTAGPSTLCVRNASAQPHVFAVEAPEAGRRVRKLAPGEQLCVHGALADRTGVVSAFEDFDAMEGCSRIVAVGRTEDMLKYVDFDRCFWSSNSPSSIQQQ
ncbi:hypothetical protein [Rhodosalinus sp. K401]|uniref:hypothetical protein n=1 Tax=Rhodosalinus sp. K401 TaxID=3239195 RepID=UPI0035232107